MRELLFVVVAPMAPLLGLAAFETWWSAVLYLTAISAAMFFAVRRHEGHHRPKAFDDKLSSERMEAARKWLMED